MRHLYTTWLALEAEADLVFVGVSRKLVLDPRADDKYLTILERAAIDKYDLVAIFGAVADKAGKKRTPSGAF